MAGSTGNHAGLCENQTVADGLNQSEVSNAPIEMPIVSGALAFSENRREAADRAEMAGARAAAVGEVLVAVGLARDRDRALLEKGLGIEPGARRAPAILTMALRHAERLAIDRETDRAALAMSGCFHDHLLFGEVKLAWLRQSGNGFVLEQPGAIVHHVRLIW